MNSHFARQTIALGLKMAPKVCIIICLSERGNPYRPPADAGYGSVSDQTGEREQDWVRSECRPITGRIGIIYRVERRLTYPWSNMAGKLVIM